MSWFLSDSLRINAEGEYERELSARGIVTICSVLAVGGVLAAHFRERFLWALGGLVLGIIFTTLISKK
ncbi:hypothetical protein UAM5_00041 [Ralstonia phage UAM5]|nr:hypothetical protein UAM5_00041 [Ralstonia phage UAM5]